MTGNWVLEENVIALIGAGRRAIGVIAHGIDDGREMALDIGFGDAHSLGPVLMFCDECA